MERIWPLTLGWIGKVFLGWKISKFKNSGIRNLKLRICAVSNRCEIHANLFQLAYQALICEKIGVKNRVTNSVKFFWFFYQKVLLYLLSSAEEDRKRKERKREKRERERETRESSQRCNSQENSKHIEFLVLRTTWKLTLVILFIYLYHFTRNFFVWK